MRVQKVFKVRCTGDCPGHVGDMRVDVQTPQPGVPPDTLTRFTDSGRDAWLAQQDERWRETSQITGRWIGGRCYPGGGERRVKFVPLEGWKIKGGLWKLTARAREQRKRGYSLERPAPRILGRGEHMSEGSNRGDDWAPGYVIGRWAGTQLSAPLFNGSGLWPNVHGIQAQALSAVCAV